MRIDLSRPIVRLQAVSMIAAELEAEDLRCREPFPGRGVLGGGDGAVPPIFVTTYQGSLFKQFREPRLVIDQEDFLAEYAPNADGARSASIRQSSGAVTMSLLIATVPHIALGAMPKHWELIEVVITD